MTLAFKLQCLQRSVPQSNMAAMLVLVRSVELPCVAKVFLVRFLWSTPRELHVADRIWNEIVK